jgi:hypothetical protein
MTCAAAVAFFVLMLGVNYLANALPLNGQTTAAVANEHPVLFTPAAYVFAIWGVIYLLLAGFAIYQIASDERTQLHERGITGLFILSSVFNSLWLVAWHYNELVVSLLMIAGLLVTLASIYARIQQLADRGAVQYWLVRVPFSIYLAWTSVATIANVAVVLYAAGWRGGVLGEVGWTVIMLLVGTVLAAVSVIRNRDVAFGAVFVWAFIGIALRQTAWQTVVMAAWACAGLLALLMAFILFRRVQQGVPQQA